MEATKFFALILALVGVAPSDCPRDIQLKAGDKIVAIGDSITRNGGYLTYTDGVLSQQYPDLKIPPITNVGIGGQKAEDLVVRFDKDVIQHKPSIVTISIGINDVWHRVKAPHDEKVLAAYKQNVAKMVDDAQKAGIRVILLAPTIITEDPKAEGNIRLPMYVKAMKEVATEKKCQFVDLHEMFLEALKSKPADFKGNYFTQDGVHMNERGNGIMAVGLLRALGVSDEKINASKQVPLKSASQPASKPAGEATSKPAAGKK